MTLSSSERERQVDAVLAGLTALRGVTAASVVDNDGFVIQIRRDFEVDTDALGAGVQVVFSASSRASEQSGQGETTLVLVENKGGLILLVPLSNDFVLAVIADSTAMLGAIRYEARQSAPALERLF